MILPKLVVLVKFFLLFAFTGEASCFLPASRPQGRIYQTTKGKHNVASGWLRVAAASKKAETLTVLESSATKLTAPNPDYVPLEMNGTESVAAIPVVSSDAVVLELAGWEDVGSNDDANGSEDILLMTQELIQEREIVQMVVPSILSKTVSPWEQWLEKPTLWQSRIIVILASALYGTNFASLKMLDERLDVSVSAALRFSLAAAVLVGMVWNQEQENKLQVTSKRMNEENAVMENRLEATIWGLEVGVWYCVGYLFQAYALQSVDASKSSFFNTLAVVVVPVLDSLFNQKSLGTNRILSIFMALSGVALLQFGPTVLADLPSSGVAHHTPMEVERGDIFCLMQALFFGIGYFRLERASVLYPDQAGRMTAGQLVAVALGSIASCFVVGDGISLQQVQHLLLTDPFIVKTLVWTGLMSTAFALYLETVALKTISATELTILMTSIGLFGSAFAYFSIGELLHPVAMVGGLLILAGCISSSMSDHHSEDRGDF